MAKKLIVSLPAFRDIDAIAASVTEYTGSPLSAIKLADGLFEQFEYLANFPKVGRKIAENKRQIFFRHYRIVYQETDGIVEIITVIHSRRKYP